jgi:hypothetical protein
VRFWAFFGKGSSKTRETKLSTFQKKVTGKTFFRGGFFFWVNFFNFFSFRFLLLRCLSASRSQIRAATSWKARARADSAFIYKADLRLWSNLDLPGVQGAP